MTENISQPQAPTPIPQPIINQPKSPLPLVLSLIIVALISGGGVYFWQQNEIKKLQTIPEWPASNSGVLETPTATPTATPTTTILKNQFSLGGISLTIPSKWRVESNNGKTARILTDFPSYKVELIVNLQNLAISDSNYESSFNNTKTAYGEAFRVLQGGAFDVTGIKINEKIYLFEWEIASNEPVPTDLDGIWQPKHNVTESDIWNITISAQPAN